MNVALAIIWNWRELAVVLHFVLELGQLCNNLFAFTQCLIVLSAVRGAMDIINALCYDDRPSLSRRCMRERCRITGLVLS